MSENSRGSVLNTEKERESQNVSAKKESVSETARGSVPNVETKKDSVAENARGSVPNAEIKKESVAEIKRGSKDETKKESLQVSGNGRGSVSKVEKVQELQQVSENSGDSLRKVEEIEPVVEEEDESEEDLTSALGLHERLEERDMQKLQIIFSRMPDHRLTQEQLRKVLADHVGCTYDDEQMNMLFMKINTNRDEWATWDEFVSHLLLGFQNDDPLMQKEAMKMPITGHPTIIKSRHRLPISRISYCPTVMQDRTTSFLEGSYVTASRDGVCNWWTLDMEGHRSAKSTSTELKIHPTWILDMVCLPDLNILCTSSTERDLRFYDTTAKNFVLRINIISLPFPVCTMYYKFYQDINQDNVMVLGDMGGHIKVISFSAIMKGPFANSPGVTVLVLRYDNLAKGEFSRMRVTEFFNVHTDVVRQTDIYEPLHCFISCSETGGSLAFPPPGLIICDISGAEKTHYAFKVPRGVSVFTYDETVHRIVTGGPDCVIRMWNVFVPTKPSFTLPGHHAGICMLVIQQEMLYSMSKDKVLKVWDLPAQSILQTYINLVSDMPDRCLISSLYNPITRELILGGMRIAVLECDPQLNENHTDGFTHNQPVTIVLYNSLFKCVVSCGLDSCIIVWDPWTGRRLCLVKEAHTRVVHGEVISVEITAATFDPHGQLLITGARNGTLKVWNFNTGICLRNMAIESMCEVTAVFWFRGRILAVGWNRHVTEFADSGTGVTGKQWESRHAEDVLCAATRIGQCLASSSYSGELIFWRLETGQAYRRFNVAHPTGRIKLMYIPAEPSPSGVKALTSMASRTTTRMRTKKPSKLKKKIEEPKRDSAKSKSSSSVFPSITGAGSSTSARARSASIYKRGSIVAHDQAPPEMAGVTSGTKEAYARRVSVVQMPTTAALLRPLSIHAIVFLESRPMSPDIGSLLLSLQNGKVQLWSHHPVGGFKGTFDAIHTAGDYISSMHTDPLNEYLFTGTTAGYVKIWLMKNYGYFDDNDVVHASLPHYRLLFPFMWHDRVDGRAKRCLRNQPLPVLLNSYRAHMRTITSLKYVPTNEILITASSDRSVRLWTLGGRYLGTLGTFRTWDPIPMDGPVPHNYPFRAPADLKQSASFTSLKVYQGGEINKYTPFIVDADANRRDISAADYHKVYGVPLKEPLLGNYFKLPERGELKEKPVLDTSLNYIPVYRHLEVCPAIEPKRPVTPEAVAQMKKRAAIANVPRESTVRFGES